MDGMSSRRILLFGGSFNPPTLAHEAIIQACLALPQFDGVWVLPSGSRADKAIGTADDRRMGMLQAVHREVFGGDPRLRISDFELQLPRPTETRRTLPALRVAYPGIEFWFACGDDVYHSMPDWPGADEFMPGLGLVVFTEAPITEGPHVVRLHVPVPVQAVSSTRARISLAGHQDVCALVSPPVLAYITAQGLYAE